MKVSEEMNETVSKQDKQKNETSTGNFDYAKKWLIACVVLFLILIILAVVLQFVKTGEVWDGGINVPLVSTSNS